MTAVLRLLTSRTPMNTTAGKLLSNTPLPPPMRARKCRTDRSCPGSSATDCLELVLRVEQRDLAVPQRQAAARHERSARVDPPDPPPSQPDEGDGPRSVVQLGLEGRHAGERSEDDGTQGARDADRLADRAVLDRGRPGPLGLGLQ